VNALALNRTDGLCNTDMDLAAPFQLYLAPVKVDGRWRYQPWPVEMGRTTPVRSKLQPTGGYRVHPNACCPHCGGTDAPRKTVWFDGDGRKIPFTFCRECVRGKVIIRSVRFGQNFWTTQTRETGWIEPVPDPPKPIPEHRPPSWWRRLLLRLV